ncbi:MAG: cysteine--tRNA ligase [Candidatus Omnitrophica bacterium]|nr:cysteine--tRNA ligase [Candidatus Omnitrophota bacterium]
MPIFIYNSLSRKKEEFKSLEPQKIKMYVCGPTVYDQPHIGHARSAYIFDAIRRYLIYKGYKVTFVRNVTDVDDKIIDKARQEYPGEDLNSAVQKTAKKYLDAYHEDMRQLGILDPDVEPKATEYIPQMQKFIEELIKRGVAYTAGGDVYFDIKKAKDYGKLSHQAIEKMESGARIAPGEKKKDPLDFALWKSAKVNEPSWDSPWEKGRPGWHIECSVMSSDILGDEFDIHGGGLDLIFPHHENEIAQSEGAGKKFARYWLHHGLLTINGQKMSKSLGNFITVKGFMGKHKYPDLLKLLFLSTHYLHPVDYTDDKIEEAKKALERFEILFKKIMEAKIDKKKNRAVNVDFVEKGKNEFIEAMNDDFNTPRALGCLFKLVTDTHKFIESGKEDNEYADKVEQAGQTIINLSREVFGLSLLDEVAANDSLEVIQLLSAYEEARKIKDYVKADAIREKLKQLGMIVEIAKDGRVTSRKSL